MIRVLHVFSNLNLGGAESRIMDVYRYINKEKYQFDFLIFTNEHCYFEDEILSLGGRIYRIVHPAVSLSKHILQLTSIIKNNSFQAIHAHTSYFSGLIVFIAWCYGIKYRVSHARNQAIGRHAWHTGFVLLTGRLLCRFFSTSLLAISKNSGVFLFGNSKYVEVVPNSFEFDKIKNKSTYKLNKNRTLSDINLVMVARLSKVKNHIFAIKLIKKMTLSKATNVKLHLIGAGDEEAKIRSVVQELALEDNVFFWGRRNDIKELLCEFDCLILPSHSEGLGVAALEGQAAGLPCIVSDGVPDEVDIGLGLLKKLPLDIEIWDTTINEMLLQKRVSKEIIDERFNSLGFTIRQTANIYLKKYGIF